jgi:F0F1-type ATP synthase assembly protein I
MLARIIQYFTRNPKKLFLTDAIGAIVTALSWLIWKLLFEGQFQFHVDVLNGLIFYAIAMFSASMQFYLFAKKDFRRCINFLIFGNTGFVLILLSLLYYFWNKISFLPKIYMLFECLIVSNLVYLEFKVKENLRN